MRRAAVAIGLAFVLLGCDTGGKAAVDSPSPGTATNAIAGASVVPQRAPPPPFVGQGGHSTTTLAVGADIACGPGRDVPTPQACQDAGTAALVQTLNTDAVAMPGDLQYDSGSLAEFTAVFDRAWRPFAAKTLPAPGNHEYVTPGGRGYFDYFDGPGRSSGRAGDRGKGYYSVDLNRGWHLITLNSNCGGDPSAPLSVSCAAGSPQERWLKADLRAHANQCIVAQWHHPLYSSGPNQGTPNDQATQAFWRDLYAYRATLVLNGHDHDYERFRPQDARGQVDVNHGIREFVVGTGGKSLFPRKYAAPNSEVFSNTTFGVMVLTLRRSTYDWRFVPDSTAGNGTFTDHGSAACNPRSRHTPI